MSDLIQIGIDVNTNIKQATADLDKMGGSVVSNIRTIDRLKAEVKQLNNALSKGSATDAAYAKGMRQINNELSIFQQRASKATIATNKLSAAQHQTKNRMNGNNMAIQQLGYQFGDFAVQVQGGTSAFVAFSQQGAQLAGILPMIAGPLGLTMGAAVGLSAALGIIIPIIGVVGRALFEMMGGAEKSKDAIGDLSTSLEQYREAVELSVMSTEKLEDKFGSMGKKVQALSDLFKNVALSKAMDALNEGTGMFSENLAGAVDYIRDLQSRIDTLKSPLDSNTGDDVLLFNKETIEILKNDIVSVSESLGLLPNQVLELSDALKNVNSSQTMEGLRDTAYEALKAIEGMRFETGKVPAEVQKVVDNLEEVLGAAARATDAVNNSQNNLYKKFDAHIVSYQKYLDKIAQANAYAQQELDLLIQKNVLLELELQYGKDSSIYKAMALDFEILNLRAKLEAKNIDETIIKGQIQALKIEKDITGQLANQLALKKLQAQFEQKPQGGRGGDPRKQGGSFIDWNTIEATKFLEDFDKNARKATKSMKDADKAAERLRKELEAPMVNAIDSVSNAFGDFIANGLKDFKGFASSILDSFKGMIAQMIATAARNKIMLSMGMSGNGGGSVASQAGGSIIGGMAKSAFGSILQGGFTGASAFGHGVTTSLGLGSTINGTVASVLSPTMASVGSIVGSLAGPLLAVGAAFSFLRTRTKELDSGLRVTVDNMDVLVKSFKTIQKSRFFGLSKKVRTSEEEASSDISDPIVNAVVTIQESVMEAASAFGVASDKFNDFTYDFEVSLKGLTEDQKMEKLNEEFTKLGDTFTEMSELFTNMNDLLAVYQQRLELEKQLLVAQGDVVKLREQELETIHVLNRDLATRLHLLQAEGDTQSALTAFASGISEQQGLIRRAVDALVKPLQDAIDRTRTQAEKSYSIFKTAADKSADSAKNIVDIITSALDSRTIISESAELMRYQTAQKQLASFAGGAEFDEASLRKATEGVSIDSQKFFGSFEDYARDFYRTQINLEDLAAVAEKELSEVEQQIDIAQKAYEVAMGTYQEAVDLNTAIETLAKDLNIYEATKLANEPLIKMVQDEGDRQIELLDSILVETTKQVNTQLGIESSMADLVGNTVSIGEAMDVLSLEAESLAGGVLALEDIERDINGNVTDLGLYVVDFEGAVEKLDTSVFDLTGTVDDLDGDIKTLFDNINLLDGGIDDFGVKVDGLGVSTDNLGIDITSLGATLSSAMSSLGSIVSGLSSAVSGLASSNNNLAAAQQKATSAAKISTLTTSAAGIAAEISSIESSAGTTAAGATPTQESQLAILKQDLLEEQSKDGADRNLGTAHFNTLINNLNKEIATQVVAAELSSEDSARLALLSGNLETMRQEVTNLGETPTFATGGYHSGGMRLVGENGPELEATGPSRIYSAQQTRNMLSGGSGEVVVELRSLRREVSELKAEQRKVGVENVKYNKKSYDLYREWDTVGLPATRTA